MTTAPLGEVGEFLEGQVQFSGGRIMDITKVISVSAACLALILAAAALVVSLTHAGPQGLRGAQGLKGIQGAQGTSGSAGLSARLAHLGVCVSSGSADGDYGYYVEEIDPPALTTGVASCPNGSFVSVVPAR